MAWAGRGGIGQKMGILACLGTILLTPGAVLPQSVIEDEGACPAETTLVGELLGWVDATLEWWNGPTEALPVSPPRVPALPPLPPPRYPPIRMSACAQKIQDLDLELVANATRFAECVDQHACTMRRYYTHTAEERGIDPTFYMALKWRESRWMHWELDGDVRVSGTDDWGSAQINRPNFERYYAEEFDWDQVVGDPLYNTRVGASILAPNGGSFGCLDYAERRLNDHFALREFLSPFVNRMPAEIQEEARRLANLPRVAFRREVMQLSPELNPYHYMLRNLTWDGQKQLRRLMDGGPDRWQAQVNLGPHAAEPFGGPTPRQIHEAAYACYNGGGSKWRRPWYTRSRYMHHVEEFRRDLDLMENLDDLIWDDDYIDELRARNSEEDVTRAEQRRNQDVEHLLRSLRSCTERPDPRRGPVVSRAVPGETR